MEIKIIMIYCLCDEFVKAYGFKDDRQSTMTTAEVMTTALVAMLLFSGNFERSRYFLQSYGYIPKMLSKSRFNRRLHAIPQELWQSFFALLSEINKQNNTSNEYICDSLPIPVCDNIRITRCKIYQGKIYRGYIASKHRYFYGLRVHLLITSSGKPVEFVIAPGGVSDISVFKSFDLDLPPSSIIYADKCYNDYQWEDFLKECADIKLQPLRKKNSHRSLEPWEKFLFQRIRKRIETTFSQIASLLGRNIHAVTSQGFELKVVLFIINFTISPF